MVYGTKEKEKKRKYYEKNKERINESNRNWRNSHKELMSNYLKDWIKNNKEKFNELMRRNYWRNKKKQLARRKAIKIKIPVGTICQICQENIATERHHPDYDFPLVIVFVCKSCNEKL